MRRREFSTCLLKFRANPVENPAREVRVTQDRLVDGVGLAGYRRPASPGLEIAEGTERSCRTAST